MHAYRLSTLCLVMTLNIMACSGSPPSQGVQAPLAPLVIPVGWTFENASARSVSTCSPGVEHCEAVTVSSFRDPLSQGDRGAVYKLCNQREGNLTAQEFAFRLTKEMQLPKGGKILADDVRAIDEDRRGRVVVSEPFAGYRRYHWYEYKDGAGWKIMLQDVNANGGALRKPFEALVRSTDYRAFEKKVPAHKCKAHL